MLTRLEDSFFLQICINYIIMSTAIGSIISEAIHVFKLNIIFEVYSMLLCFCTSLFASQELGAMPLTLTLISTRKSTSNAQSSSVQTVLALSNDHVF